MRKLLLFFAVSFFAINTANATTNNYNNDTPFIFIENNIEYAVFRNGDFDFNILNNRNSSVRVNAGLLNISFNTGRNYSPYVETNRYGEISLINRTPIFYDYQGRVSRIGNINVNYNRLGFVSSIGNLNVLYNRNGTYNCSTGYVNIRNRNYNSYSRAYVHPTSRKKIIRERVAYRTTNKYNNRNRGVNYYHKNKTNSKSNNYRTASKSSNKQNNNSRSVTKNTKQLSKKANSSNSVVYSKRTNSNTYRR